VVLPGPTGRTQDRQRRAADPSTGPTQFVMSMPSSTGLPIGKPALYTTRTATRPIEQRFEQAAIGGPGSGSPLSFTREPRLGGRFSRSRFLADHPPVPGAIMERGKSVCPRRKYSLRRAHYAAPGQCRRTVPTMSSRLMRGASLAPPAAPNRRHRRRCRSAQIAEARIQNDRLRAQGWLIGAAPGAAPTTAARA